MNVLSHTITTPNEAHSASLALENAGFGCEFGRGLFPDFVTQLHGFCHANHHLLWRFSVIFGCFDQHFYNLMKLLEFLNLSYKEEYTNMAIKRALKNILESLTGIHIFRELPRGISVVHDIARQFLGYRFNIIFDVGANVGQSAFVYLSSYPSSTIYCFEPIAETYNNLRIKMKGKSQVNCFMLALGSSSGKGTMISEGTSTRNCLVDKNSALDRNIGKTEQVDISTIDHRHSGSKERCSILALLLAAGHMRHLFIRVVETYDISQKF